MNGWLLLFVMCFLLMCCTRFEGKKGFSEFDYCRIQPVKENTSSLNFDVTYHDGNIVRVDCNDNIKHVISDTLVYKNGDVFLFRMQQEDCPLCNDTMMSVTGIVSDTVRSFIFSKNDKVYELLFVETPLSDSVMNIEYVHKSDIKFANSNENLAILLSAFRQYVQFYAFAQEITFVYEGKTMRYTTVDNYGTWKATGGTDTLYNIYGNIYLDRYRIYTEDLLPAFKLFLSQERLICM